MLPAGSAQVLASALVAALVMMGGALGPPVDRAPAASAAPGSEVAADGQQVTLRLISQRPKRSNDYAALGLTGVNKPNGVGYRLRADVPEKTPGFVPRAEDGLELFVADATADGWLAFYRTPMERWEGAANPEFAAVLFSPSGERRWKLGLNDFLSRPDRLEIQDVRYSGGRLYFNEACQSYSREAGGRCSRLVRVNPAARSVDWRTPPLTSNNVFILHGPWVIAGYGFTAEPDFLHVVDRETGSVLARRRLDSAASYLEMKDGRLHVVTYNSVYVFELSSGAAGGR
jgi:hypothetical protein